MFDFDEFSQRLQSLRKKKNMTQGEFAERLGVTAQAVSKWENGQNCPDIALIPIIATILDVEVNYLFGTKKKSSKSEISFPKICEGMSIVHSYQNVACYSSKTVESIHDSLIKFVDGSAAELSNNLVTNIGKGEIRLLVIDDTDKNTDLSYTSKEFEFDYVDSLDIEVISNKCLIVYSTDHKCRVRANGETRFISMLNVTVQEEKLIVRFDNKEDYNSHSCQRNNIVIELPCESGKVITAKINGSGELKSEINLFESGKLSINGSGAMLVRDFVTCSSSINGSGSIRALFAEKVNMSINGSGDIEWNAIQNLEASINGSGDINVVNAKSVYASINGAGDLSIGRLIDDGNATLRIAGSGDICIGSGSCQKFDAFINGSGDINATGLTARKASIIIQSNGEVTLGRVIESSIEQIKKKGIITILNRGELQ